MGLRDEINLIVTRIFEIEKSRHALTRRSISSFGPGAEQTAMNENTESSWERCFSSQLQFIENRDVLCSGLFKSQFRHSHQASPTNVIIPLWSSLLA